MVTLRRTREVDPPYEQLSGEQDRELEALRREGRLLGSESAAPDAADWRCYLLFRERDPASVETTCARLPLKDYLDFEIVALGREN